LPGIASRAFVANVHKEARMKILSPRTITILSLLLIMAAGRTAPAQGPAMARPNYPPPLVSLPEARAIIEGAIAYARDANLRMAVVVVDHAGNVVSADRMDGASLQNIRFAEGKAFASALYRVPGQDLSRGRRSAACRRRPACRRGWGSRIARRRRREIGPGWDCRFDEIT
jgi:hypothetical protein